MIAKILTYISIHNFTPNLTNDKEIRRYFLFLQNDVSYK